MADKSSKAFLEINIITKMEQYDYNVYTPASQRRQLPLIVNAQYIENNTEQSSCELDYEQNTTQNEQTSTTSSESVQTPSIVDAEFVHNDRPVISRNIRDRIRERRERFQQNVEEMEIAHQNFLQNIIALPHNYNVLSGLTSERISKFEHFTADESLAGEQCLVCMDELTIGTQMVRLDCHVDHILCKKCVDQWFKDHNTCPTCRHAFK